MCRVLNELLGASFTSTDEQALQQVVETFFLDDSDSDIDTPFGNPPTELVIMNNLFFIILFLT